MDRWRKMTPSAKLGLIVVAIGVICLLLIYALPSGSPTSPAQLGTKATPTAQANSTTVQAPTKIKPPPGPTATPTYSGTITMTASDFSPQTARIRVGQVVHFVNGTSLTMRIYSPPKPGEPNSGFDQEKSVGHGGSYDLLFNNSGTFTFYNLNGNHAMIGVIVVEAQ